MRKIKTFLLILIIIISFSSIVYADPIDYTGEWITGSYTNIEGLKDKSHFVLDENFLISHSLSESDIVSLHLTGYTNTIESHYTTSYFPGMTYVCGSGECYGRYEWAHSFEANGMVITINYLRYYEAKGDTGCIISFAGPPCIYVTEGVIYSEFYATIETAPGVTERYYSDQIGEWVEVFEVLDPTHGTITISKEPTFVFTKWHRLNDESPAGMDLTISWDTTKPIVNIEANITVIRYQDMGEDFYEIYNDEPNSSSGVIEEHIEFNHAGTEESFLYIKFITEEGNIGEITAPIPINGYFGINLSEPAGPVDEIFLKSAADVETFNF